jgi:hypothetical protein
MPQQNPHLCRLLDCIKLSYLSETRLQARFVRIFHAMRRRRALPPILNDTHEAFPSSALDKQLSKRLQECYIAILRTQDH